MDSKTMAKIAALSGFALSSMKLGDGKAAEPSPIKDKTVEPIAQVIQEQAPDITVRPNKIPTDTAAPEVFMHALNNPQFTPPSQTPLQDKLPEFKTPDKDDPIGDFKDELNDDCEDYIEMYDSFMKGKDNEAQNFDKEDLVSDAADLRVNLLINNDLIPSFEVAEKVGEGMNSVIEALNGVDPNSPEGQNLLKEIQKAGKNMASSMQKNAQKQNVSGDNELIAFAAWNAEKGNELGDDLNHKNVDNFIKRTYKKAKAYTSDYAHSVKEKASKMAKSFSVGSFIDKGRE